MGFFAAFTSDFIEKSISNEKKSKSAAQNQYESPKEDAPKWKRKMSLLPSPLPCALSCWLLHTVPLPLPVASHTPTCHPFWSVLFPFF